MAHVLACLLAWRALQESEEAWQAVQKDSDPMNWCIMELGTKNRKEKFEVQLIAQGPGGLPHLQPFIDETKCQWGGFRVTAVDEAKGEAGAGADGEDHSSLRPRFLSFFFMGEQMPGALRGRIATDGCVVLSDFNNVVKAVRCFGKDELSCEVQCRASSAPCGRRCVLRADRGAARCTVVARADA